MPCFLQCSMTRGRLISHCHLLQTLVRLHGAFLGVLKLGPVALAFLARVGPSNRRSELSSTRKPIPGRVLFEAAVVATLLSRIWTSQNPVNHRVRSISARPCSVSLAFAFGRTGESYGGRRAPPDTGHLPAKLPASEDRSRS